jgi:hypothetical protein
MLVICANPKFGVRFVDLATRHWPRTNARKQMYIISLLELVISHIPDVLEPMFLNSIFRILADCTFGSFYNANCVLSLWLKLDHADFLRQHSRKIFPVVYPAFASAADRHWNPEVRESAAAALKIMRAMDLETVEECALNNVKRASTERSCGWLSIAREASLQHSEVNLRLELRKMQTHYGHI